MMLGGVGRLMRGLSGGTASFSPISLFSAGEQGFWYDPSDFSTMFQDAAGTTPVTATGQPVGLIFDKSKGLVLGSELATAPDLSWNASAAPDTANLAPVVSGLWYRFEWTGLSTTSTTGTSLRIGATLLSPNRQINNTTPSSGVQYFQATATGNLLVNATTNANNIGSYSSVSVRQISGNHAIQITDASRPVLGQEAGGQYYLAFDGTDDSFVTNTIDFTSTDKVSAFAGVRKLSDAAVGIPFEFSTSVNVSAGSFAFLAPHAAGSASYRFNSRGTILASPTQTNPVIAAPNTSVLSGLGDISGDIARLRVNGVQVNQVITDQGTGNFGNYALYIGSRAGTTFFFNGRIYGIVCVGRFLSDSEVSSTETWLNGKTGAY